MTNRNYIFSARNRMYRAEQCAEGAANLCSVNLDAIKNYAETNGIVLEQAEPRDPWGLLPKVAASQAAFEFLRLFQTGFKAWTRVPPIYRFMVDSATGRSGISSRLLCSNALVRERAAHCMIDVVSDLWKASRHVPGRRWFFATIMGDSGNMLEYHPEMNLKAFKRTVNRIITDTRLDAIGAIEFQAINNFPQQGNGRTLMANAHFICWTDDHDFDAATTAKRLSAASPLTHWLGARTVLIEPIEHSHRHLTWKASYLMKAPTICKVFRRDQATPSGWGFSGALIRGDLAVRLTELLSQLKLPDLVMAVGDGVPLRNAWHQALERWHQEQLTRLAWPDDGDMGAVWADLHPRRARGEARFPFDLDVTDAGQSKWLTAALGKMQSLPDTRRHTKKTRL